MDFRKYLEQSQRQLDREVQKILNQWLKGVRKIDRKLIPLTEAFIQANFGGKRIRGALVMLGYELCNSEFRIQNSEFKKREILKVGAAYEIFHTSILAHDDIMDKSPTRRGNESLYKSVGISQAITLGDLGFFLAIKVISESKFPEDKKNQALNLFSKIMVDTAVGQMLDIQKGNPLLVVKLKTAQYTISGPLQIGVILAGAEEKLSGLLGEFGEDLGIAYQIRDDILDGEVLDYGGQSALKYVAQAKKYIPKITSDKIMRKLLEDMAEYLVTRKT